LHTSDFNRLDAKTPDKYIALTVGKTAITDYFDTNKYSQEARTRFLTASLTTNGAWDYPSDAHGYTNAIVVEYVSPQNELRYAASLLPTSANGDELSCQLHKSLSHTVEYTRHYTLGGQAGAIRLLGYYTRATMGNYRMSLDERSSNPIITSTQKKGRTKYGFGINAEQAITPDLGCFLRAGWNDGKNETWCFTEADQTLSGGFVLQGNQWKRQHDNIGLGYVISGLSQNHSDYLAAGGKGMVLGDGKLNYAPEQVLEFYYSAELKKGFLYLTGTYQLLFNPGYNQDRNGSTRVFSIRLHARM
jgi:high affinity Mn2+ porin